MTQAQIQGYNTSPWALKQGVGVGWVGDRSEFQEQNTEQNREREREREKDRERERERLSSE